MSPYSARRRRTRLAPRPERQPAIMTSASKYTRGGGSCLAIPLAVHFLACPVEILEEFVFRDPCLIHKASKLVGVFLELRRANGEQDHSIGNGDEQFGVARDICFSEELRRERDTA